MKPLSETYSGRFFRTRHRIAWRAPHICKAVIDVFNPSSVVDVGCAIGDIVKGFLDLGIPAVGLEGSGEAVPYMMIDKKYYDILDLRKPIGMALHPVFDLVTCFEVAEHIEEEFADMFVDNLILLSNRILATFAVPGQKGYSHVNCQPLEYWLKKFFMKGYFYYPSHVDNFRKRLEPIKSKNGVKAFFGNGMAYFEKAV